jgi:hypothetical protein
MNNQRVKAFRLSFSFLAMAFLISALPAFADSSHTRIIRLSYVQGDVRIAHNISGDPLQAGDSAWERATLNLPLHQGDVVATDNGRAEVEFESGNIAFLAENTVLQFYDLSLEDGSFTTRLILRQGSASFYVRPEHGDYFSVTGGDFSVEANERAQFRLNNYDDGSDVQVLQGHISVLSKDKTTHVSKGQSLSMKADSPASLALDQLTGTDDFDQWVNGRLESGQQAVAGSRQYTGVYDYDSGFGDLYTYGGWYPVAGYGYCWRPYGVSFGWNPFQMGNWYFDPFFNNWVFIGSQPWGWLPYHYGGWIFQPGFGWVWNPRGPNRGVPYPHVSSGSFAMARGAATWRPVTATWVKSGDSVALVPTHPLDVHGKEPINLQQGIFPVSRRGVSDPVSVSTVENWKNMNRGPARDFLPNDSVGSAAPVRVVRTMADGKSATGVAVASHGELRVDSGITYDPAEHRFVNNSAMRLAERTAAETETGNAAVAGGRQIPQVTGARNSDVRRGTETAGTRNSSVTSTRGAQPPAARTSMPAPPNPGARSGSAASGGGSRWNGSSSGSSRSTWGGSSSSSSSSSSRSSGSSSSSSGSSGGRPH